jgi:hypothetical protein
LSQRAEGRPVSGGGDTVTQGHVKGVPIMKIPLTSLVAEQLTPIKYVKWVIPGCIKLHTRH